MAQTYAAVAIRGPVFLLWHGASISGDRGDVIPEAVVAAGGHIDHFGMPVDPGNMLLLCHIGETPVLGLPGCARSPKVNGFDWVLERLAPRLPVGPPDNMRVGAGRLFGGVPAPPVPRAPARPAPPRPPPPKKHP